jgi:N-acyl-phosphatidylethanolamine-hydrolysing phospholipase D
VTGRFADRATQPGRGPRDILRWKLGKKEPRADDFAALDAVRPAVVDGGAEALASGRPVAVWIGHATWALRLAGKLIVIDPIWSRSIGGAVRRLVPPGIALEAMPAIDVVLVSHDHRDHMDLPTLRRLPDSAQYIVPVGNAARLAKPRVVELDWWQSFTIGDLAIALVPARHWSMRMPWNRNDTLWGGWVIRAPEGNAYHSGDTAWGDHFAEIGARCGPIHWAMLPIGGYAPRWFMAPQHIDPVEAVGAWEALRATELFAMHWGTFRLTDEPIGEPPARLRACWAERNHDPARLHIPDPGAPLPLV